MLQVCGLRMFSQNWSKISNRIATCQKQMLHTQDNSTNEIFKYFIKKYNEVRRESRIFEQLNVQKSDTVYILERTDQVNLSLLSTIWAQSNMFSYSASYVAHGKYEVELVKETYFSKKMLDLASQWNIEEIRKEEKINQSLPFEMIYLTRIIINGKKPKIDCIMFNDFWNLNHD